MNRLVALAHVFWGLAEVGAEESFRARVWMVGWEGRSLAVEAHRGRVWVAVNGSPATITIETCEDPSDWTTAIGGTGPSGWAPCGRGAGDVLGGPGRGAGGPKGPPGGHASAEGGAVPGPPSGPACAGPWAPGSPPPLPVARSPPRLLSGFFLLAEPLRPPQMTRSPSGEGSRTRVFWTRSYRSSTRS